MKMTAALALATLNVLSACEDISPFIDDELFADRLDLDGDGTPNAQDCAPNDPKITTLTFWNDLDGDGFGAGAAVTNKCKLEPGLVDKSGDCGDGNNKVFPGVPEVCNLIDDNCNDDVDEGFTSHWCRDKDQDGFGNPADCKDDCGAPNGYVGNDDDCNDNEPGVKPGALDVCDDLVDQNCDGKIDNAEEATLWFEDLDGDGAGNPAVSFYSCKTHEDHIITAGDCNDDSPSVGPGAPEACEDMIDNDCDGTTDTDAVDVSWFRDFDEDGFGDEKIAQTACKPPAGFVGNDLDCDDTKNTVKPGIAEVCNNGIDDNCDHTPNECLLIGIQQADSAHTMIHGNASNLFIDTLTWIGDFNDDGNDDFMIGVRYDDNAGDNAGAAYLFLGPINMGVLSLNNATAIWTGENSGDFAGETISGGGDVNGDGKADVLISATGVVYLILGSNNPVSGSLSGATTKWTDEAEGDAAGRSILSSEDVNGDGKADIFIAAWLNDTAGLNAGAVYLILGSANLTGGSLSQANAKWTGELNESFAGKSVAGGDINGDGKADILISSHGAVYLILGSANLTGGSLSQANAKWTGEAVDDITGNIALVTGNINDDQKADIILGLPNLGSGRIYLILGSAYPTGGSLSQQATAKWIGEAETDLAGYSLCTGDLDNDGYDDILIGAPENDSGGNNAGKVYLIYGSTSLTSGNLAGVTDTWKGVGAIDQFGVKVSAGGDMNKDAHKDILVAAPYHDSEMKDQGTIYLYLGLGL